MPTADPVPLPVFDRRRAGVLLHPTSLPGPHGCGDLGPAALDFLDGLAAAGQSVWQVLPLGPPAYAGSPYLSLSAHAGNPLLISPERLVEDGLLEPSDLHDAPDFDAGRVDFARAGAWRETLLRRAWRRARGDSVHYGAVHPAGDDAPWLVEWSLFRALKTLHGGAPWSEWPEEHRTRSAPALAEARRVHGEEIAYQGFVQGLFARQWGELRRAARERGIRLLGDLPIYVAYDSADVWSRPELFDLDDELRPRHVAGVPPDYFSETGQLWGNPLYRWDRMAAEGYAWWVERLRHELRRVDLLRLDHFRGFQAYWQVPAGDETAENGRWVDGPGEALFGALGRALGTLPLLAEDLGDITDAVHELRRRLSLPGMRVLHFAFGADGADEDGTGDGEQAERYHAPHAHRRHAAVYTGTHDNDTSRGWYESADPDTRRRLMRYAGLAEDARGAEAACALVRLAYASPARLAVVPMQDLLGLGSEARMNAPGTTEGNWTWRLPPGSLDGGWAEELRERVELFDR